MLHLNIVLQVPEHTMGQQNAICLLSDGDCLCLISFQVKTMDIMIEFHKGILYGRIGMVTEKQRSVFPKTSQKWGVGGKKQKPHKFFP